MPPHNNMNRSSRPAEADLLELEMALHILDRENEGLKSQLKSQHASLKQATENYKKILDYQSEEIECLKADLKSIEVDIAHKDEEIKDLKVQIEKHKEEIDQFK